MQFTDIDMAKKNKITNKTLANQRTQLKNTET